MKSPSVLRYFRFDCEYNYDWFFRLKSAITNSCSRPHFGSNVHLSPLKISVSPSKKWSTHDSQSGVAFNVTFSSSIKSLSVKNTLREWGERKISHLLSHLSVHGFSFLRLHREINTSLTAVFVCCHGCSQLQKSCWNNKAENKNEYNNIRLYFR